MNGQREEEENEVKRKPFFSNKKPAEFKMQMVMRARHAAGQSFHEAVLVLLWSLNLQYCLQRGSYRSMSEFCFFLMSEFSKAGLLTEISKIINSFKMYCFNFVFLLC